MVLDATGQPLGSMPGGRVANAASILGRLGLPVIMASEAAADPVGDITVKTLTDAGVDVSSVDRYTEGRTPINIYVAGGDASTALPSLIRYEKYPDEAFDIVWPRIDNDDIVLFGGYYALDPRMRPRMQRLLAHAAERRALLIYLPGFLPQQEPRITRVMPQILENLEMANVVVTRNRDLEVIFGIKTPDACYHDHIDFYCRSLINVDAACDRISYYSGKEMSAVEIPASVSRSLMWNAGAIAGIIAEIFNSALAADALEHPSAAQREAILGAAAKSAAAATSSLTQPWQKME